MNIFRSKALESVTLLLAITFLVACEKESVSPTSSNGDGEALYVVMEDDLQLLKDDFNNDIGKVRLVFLSGPTCGICLRGMADLNDEFLAASQNDDRLHTYVIHVPTLGAKEKHVAATIPLLNGPRVSHYWEDSGIIGRHYSETLDIAPVYAWDVWMIYGPDAEWTDTLPPAPAFWQHQLGALSKAERLNPVSFADATASQLENLGNAPRLAGTVNESLSGDSLVVETEAQRVADGSVIPTVAQPRGVAIEQHIRGRGLYHNLKRITAINKTGTIEFDGVSHEFRVSTSRPANIERIVVLDNIESVGGFDGTSTTFSDPDTDRGIPGDLESQLLSSFDFDGPLVDWPDKDNSLAMIGMEKQGTVLAWKLDLVQADGAHWHLLVNSHSGDIVRATLLGDDDDPKYALYQSDFRETSGFRFPHRVEYRTSAGNIIAVETIDRIEVETGKFRIADENVTH